MSLSRLPGAPPQSKERRKQHQGRERDRDATDFRKVRESYQYREPGCPFCEMPQDNVVAKNELAYAVRDAFPVTPLHTLVIPKRHAQSYFELRRPELNVCQRLLEQEKEDINQADPNVEGFNVGVNDGHIAGQTVFHCHIHLIPRRKGDIEDPTGGAQRDPGQGRLSVSSLLGRVLRLFPESIPLEDLFTEAVARILEDVYNRGDCSRPTN